MQKFLPQINASGYKLMSKTATLSDNNSYITLPPGPQSGDNILKVSALESGGILFPVPPRDLGGTGWFLVPDCNLSLLVTRSEV